MNHIPMNIDYDKNMDWVSMQVSCFLLLIAQASELSHRHFLEHVSATFENCKGTWDKNFIHFGAPWAIKPDTNMQVYTQKHTPQGVHKGPGPCPDAFTTGRPMEMLDMPLQLHIVNIYMLLLQYYYQWGRGGAAG